MDKSIEDKKIKTEISTIILCLAAHLSAPDSSLVFVISMVIGAKSYYEFKKLLKK